VGNCINTAKTFSWLNCGMNYPYIGTTGTIIFSQNGTSIYLY
jgi:hypothetical protein